MPKISIGAERITAERMRQIFSEGWTSEHDDEEHGGSELVLAAICYAAPERIYVERSHLSGIAFADPWPDWEPGWDKRFRYGDRRDNPGNMLPDPGSYSQEERVDLLVKAGALIAAEIDRLLRMEDAP